MALKVTKLSNGQELTCSKASNCKVTYDWSYTPVLKYMTPSIVYPGMTATVGVNPMNAPNYKLDN